MIDGMTIDTGTIGTVGTIVGIVVGAFGMFRFVAGIKDTLGTRITTEAEKADTKINSVSRETRLLVEKLSESEAKSRAELSGNMMNAIADMRRDAKGLDEKFNAMRGEMIRRSDLSEIRQEIMGALDRQDRARADLGDSLEKKIEAIMLGYRARNE
jgi:preprotein translocase subunit SecF